MLPSYHLKFNLISGYQYFLLRDSTSRVRYSMRKRCYYVREKTQRRDEKTEQYPTYFIVSFYKQIGIFSKLAILPLISKLQRIANILVAPRKRGDVIAWYNCFVRSIFIKQCLTTNKKTFRCYDRGDCESLEVFKVALLSTSIPTIVGST